MGPQAPQLSPDLEGARALLASGDANVVPVIQRWPEDAETPVSAFLKLRAGEREGAPAFLL
jgi:hypothetical protein